MKRFRSGILIGLVLTLPLFLDEYRHRNWTTYAVSYSEISYSESFKPLTRYPGCEPLPTNATGLPPLIRCPPVSK